MKTRRTRRTLEQKQFIVSQWNTATNKKKFAESAGLVESTVRHWIKNGIKGKPIKNRPATPSVENYTIPIRSNKKDELENLRLENLVLRANLTMAMKLGYLDFLSLEKS